MADRPPIELSNNDRLNRYEAHIAGAVAGFAGYRVEDGRVVFTHTTVGDEWEGQGVGSALAKYALDDVVDSGRQIIPICPFIVAYIARHREYLPAVDEAYRDQF